MLVTTHEHTKGQTNRNLRNKSLQSLKTTSLGKSIIQNNNHSYLEHTSNTNITYKNVEDSVTATHREKLTPLVLLYLRGNNKT